MIVTNVDRLLAFLEENKKTTVANAAKFLKADERQIEKIANYLMEDGVISVDYKLTDIVLMINPQKEKKLLKLMPHNFAIKKENLPPTVAAAAKIDESKAKPVIAEPKEAAAKKEAKEKQTPAEMAKKFKELTEKLSTREISVDEINALQDEFQKVVESAMKERFYNKDFFRSISQFYELIESKKIVFLITAYKETKDAEALKRADSCYREFLALQAKLSGLGYIPNIALSNQLKKVLEEASK
jgi:hypothetical protein